MCGSDAVRCSHPLPYSHTLTLSYTGFYFHLRSHRDANRIPYFDSHSHTPTYPHPFPSHRR